MEKREGKGRGHLQRIGQFDQPVAVGSADHLVDPSEGGYSPRLVHARIGEVIGVHHPNHQLESLAPIGTQVVPEEGWWGDVRGWRMADESRVRGQRGWAEGIVKGRTEGRQRGGLSPPVEMLWLL